MQELLFIGIILAAVGFFILFACPLVEKYRIFHAGMPVNAVICGRKEKGAGRKKRVKFIWQFTYEGNERLYQSRYWQPEDERDTGYRGALLLRKNNPEKVYEFMPQHVKTIWRTVGMAVIGIGIIFIAAFFYMRGTIELFGLR